MNGDRELLRHEAATDFAHALVVASLDRLLHDRNHRSVAATMQELVLALGKARDAGIDMPLALQFDDARIYHDGVPLDGPSLQARTLLQRCAEREIAVLAFDLRLESDEANRLFDLLLLDENRDALRRENRERTLLACGVRHVHVTLRQPGEPDDRRHTLGEDRRALTHYQELAEALQQNHRLATRDQELVVDATAAAIERTLVDLDEPSMLLSLAMQDDVDRFTVGHSVRVALLALQVAREVGASREQLVRIGAAALMHDIGKSKVPQEILFKQGRLTDEEWHWMAQHPRLGAELLIEQHEHVDPHAICAAFCHHMGPSGQGYPIPAMKLRPSGTSNLIRVCDVFEALTAVRPYKRALTPVEAYAVMFRSEHDFDPAWLRRFVRTLGLYPVGTRVLLQDGVRALVVGQTDDIRRPMVRLLDDVGTPAAAPDGARQLRVGDALEGRPVAITGIETHDRCVALPALDGVDDGADDGAAPLDVGHACLSRPLADDRA